MVVEKPLHSYILPQHVDEMVRNSNPSIMTPISVCHKIWFFASICLFVCQAVSSNICVKFWLPLGAGSPTSAEGVF